MTEKRYHDGRLIILEHETFVTNDQGVAVRRVETVLEDGTELVQDIPVDHPGASAPTEDEVNIPFAHAVAVPESPPSGGQYSSDSPADHVEVATVPPAPPRVAVVTGPARPAAPPQSNFPSSRYVYRDERTGARMICGLSALVCFLICCGCFLPILIVPVLWVTNWGDVDDAFWEDDNY